MPFQAVPNAALVTVRGELLGEEVNNTLGFMLTTPGPVTGPALATLVAGVALVWEATMLQTLPGSYIFNDVQARALDVQDGPVAEAPGGAQAGMLAGNVMPNNVSFCVSFRTGLGGATNRGRNYICGLLESEVSDNELALGRINALRSAYQEFIGAGSVANGWQWCVISRKIIIPLVTGRGVAITNVHITDNRVDTQRRRLPR